MRVSREGRRFRGRPCPSQGKLSWSTAPARTPPFIALLAAAALGAAPAQPRREVEFLGRDFAVVIAVYLVEQRCGRRCEFLEADTAILVPILQRRGGGLVGDNPRLVDGGDLLRRQARAAAGGSVEFRTQPGHQLVASQGAIFIGVILLQGGAGAAMVILVARRQGGIRVPLRRTIGR